MSERNAVSDNSLLGRLVGFCLRNKLLVGLFVILMVVWGLMSAPFDWRLGGLPRNPVAVDAIPDIGENQQIVFTKWGGRSPQDIEDQISYPLTAALLGIPNVKSVRSSSMFGFSTIYVIFDDDVEFYWSRSRVLEKLASLPPGTLPAEVQPTLGPDATALGQVFWYTLEGRDAEGRPTGGWDLDELRSIQDWQVRYALMSAEGVSEVASVGGFLKEFQVDVDPDILLALNVDLEEVYRAIQQSNIDVGARSIEVNSVEYIVRGIGFLRNLAEIENTVIRTVNDLPLRVRDVATVSLGPALRRGALDKGGAEVVGGVVVVRYGENPLAVIGNVKEKIAEIAPGLPRRTLEDGTVSQVELIPFYDRTGLIQETLDTLGTALFDEVLVTIIVVIVMLLHLRSSLVIAGLLPLAVLMSFIAMKRFGVDANIVALSGIAIAIGTMVDMGIIVSENILKRLREAGDSEPSIAVVRRATVEVGSAVMTAVATTIISFLPVFTMEAAEGKLFGPLAFTKTFALLASIVVALVVIPPLAQTLFPLRFKLGRFGKRSAPPGKIIWIWNGLLVLAVGLLLTKHWQPLGTEIGLVRNFIFVAMLIGGLLLLFLLLQRAYPRLLAWCLDHKLLFLTLPVLLVLFGLLVWLGFDRVFGGLPDSMRGWRPTAALSRSFPGLGKEFMPSLDEGSYLLMPTTMPHASIGEALDVIQKQDMSIDAIPEVMSVVGKIGRVESPLDPAPVSMVETVINYHSRYLRDDNGKRIKFRFDRRDQDLVRSAAGEPLHAADGETYHARGRYARDAAGELIPDKRGRPFPLWRPALDPALNPGRMAWPGIRNPDDIWREILDAAAIPGTTSAPKLQPIATRLVMLQSGMRAPMGIKVKGSDLQDIERTGLELERLLKQVPGVEPSTVFADRIVGKPYLEIRIDREAIGRYGISLGKVQNVIETAIGGKQVTTVIARRERYPVRVRYQREVRDRLEDLERILVAAPGGRQIPLAQLAEISYVQGPQVIKSEDTFLVGYVLFDKRAGYSEVDVVEQARDHLMAKLAAGDFELPAGVSYSFAGSFENQVRAERKLMIVLPLALGIIFMILYLQFRSVMTTGLVFSGISVAWAGGFLLIWLYSQPWFLDIHVFGVHLRELFQVHPINLSVAVWVGFLALFGIASDDGVLMGTYLDQVFRGKQPVTRREIRELTIAGARRRIQPALMTSATTILALVPVLTSSGRGSDIMVPMAIPTFGGMIVVLLTVFTFPTLYCAVQERRLLGRGDR
ncbi:MAG: efflux RND transporter permease subunit [bacterium]|nr:efflux RND transporter permease subunit [bacterium]